MDGKHVLIRPPPNSGSYYYNYKHSFSIVLLAVVDANYKFVYVDVGCNGRVSDGGVFRNSNLFAALEGNSLNIPPPEPLTQQDFNLPYLLVADAAFPLKEYILKPYSQAGLTKERRIFNYRLSRARRIVENAFGILSNRFRVFMNPIQLAPEKVEDIVFASCSLHNFLSSKSSAQATYVPPGTFDSEDHDMHILRPGDWRQQPQSQGMASFEQQGSNAHSYNAGKVHEYLTNYFNSSTGSVPWQDNMI